MMIAVKIGISVLSVLVVAAASLYADDVRPNDDNFVTNTVNAVFDKINKVSSGETSIFIKDFDKPEEKRDDYSRDALGRKIAEPTIRSTSRGSSVKDEPKPGSSGDKDGPEAKSGI